MKWFRKLVCLLLGHRYYSVALNNFELGGRSHYGTYHCQRCGHEKDWQYDL